MKDFRSVETLNVPPFDPQRPSHAANVIVAVPLQLAVGTNRSRMQASDRSSRAASRDTAPMEAQLVPAFVGYCQVAAQQ